jgi:hypothetical protein
MKNTAPNARARPENAEPPTFANPSANPMMETTKRIFVNRFIVSWFNLDRIRPVVNLPQSAPGPVSPAPHPLPIP